MSTASATFYSEKDEGYYGTPRRDIVALLPDGGGLRLLEVGAGRGATIQLAKETGKVLFAAAVDLVAPIGGPCPGVDEFIVGDLESLALPFEESTFDVVVAADVLEHLVNPWAVVERLTRKLRPGGVFLASVPNFQNHRAWWPVLFEGDFRYERAGLRDRTHLRFFCRRNVVDLMESSGLRVELIAENMGAYGLRHKCLDVLTLRKLHDWFVFQYVVRAVRHV